MKIRKGKSALHTAPIDAHRCTSSPQRLKDGVKTRGTYKHAQQGNNRLLARVFLQVRLVSRSSGNVFRTCPTTLGRCMCIAELRLLLTTIPHALSLQRTRITTQPKLKLTALTSPKFPIRAKCCDKLALALPAHTPHKLLNTALTLSTATLSGFANAGDRQSSTIAVSLKISASRRYILHSGSNAVPSRCAKSIVASRPVESCSIVRRRACVGEAVGLPTPTPFRVLEM